MGRLFYGSWTSVRLHSGLAHSLRYPLGGPGSSEWRIWPIAWRNVFSGRYSVCRNAPSALQLDREEDEWR